MEWPQACVSIVFALVIGAVLCVLIKGFLADMKKNDKVQCEGGCNHGFFNYRGIYILSDWQLFLYYGRNLPY